MAAASVSEKLLHIPQSDKDNHPQIPWRDIAGIGNILRHGYDATVRAKYGPW